MNLSGGKTKDAKQWLHKAERIFCVAIMVIALSGAAASARHEPKSTGLPAAQESQVRIVPGATTLALETPTSEFIVSVKGYVSAKQLAARQQLSLDEPADEPGLKIVADGKALDDFAFDVANPKISSPDDKLGSRGERIELNGKQAGTVLDVSLRVEVYDEFPELALISLRIHNSGDHDVRLESVDFDRHVLDASLADPAANPNEMWSFHGASIRWGKDNVFEIPRKFSQQNQMGSLVEVKGDLGRAGGGIPVVALWTRSVGEAIGHVEILPLVLSIPVETQEMGRVEAAVRILPAMMLTPGGDYATPRAFLAVYSGDYYEPLRMYSDVIDREGLPKATTTNEDYAVSWCGWGYLSDVTPAQMLGTIPKLKEFGIHWATLDDRWFNNYGDWQPRQDTFPGDTIRSMVQKFHAQGIKVQLWWLPMAVEDGGPGYESHRYGVSEVVKEHPDWLVLDKEGKPARMTRNLATLCPALPEVRDYYKQLTERFIRDWDFDGHKLDNTYSVPACYNPKHHHNSPLDSVYGMGDVYKIIFETTRSLKPESVTQSCPCGTPPSIAWLRYLDQAVTADPVGSVQVRQRIKMYKALLGPRAAVYGDHVELTRIINPNGDEHDLGTDFASTLGTGGVLGTKFTWPDYGPKLHEAYLTPTKEAHWKKWIALYNQKMLSRGTFRDLYVYGYDVPEGYAIEKDGAMYYAFFAPAPSSGKAGTKGGEWSGEIELRGLEPGKYHVIDYVEKKDFGIVSAPGAHVRAAFKDHLLLEVTKE